MTDIKDLGLSPRAYNCLMRAGINTLEKLRDTSEEDLMMVKNLGAVTFKEVLKVRNVPGIPANKKSPSKDDSRTVEEDQITRLSKPSETISVSECRKLRHAVRAMTSTCFLTKEEYAAIMEVLLNAGVRTRKRREN